MPQSSWSKQDVDTLVKLWKEGVSSNKIAVILKRRRNAITQFLCRNRDKLGLEKRAERVGGRPTKDPFEVQWSGPVPLGHWAITKPWGNKNASRK